MKSLKVTNLPIKEINIEFLDWTKEAPTVPGFYWGMFRNKDIVVVRFDPSVHFVDVIGFEEFSLTPSAITHWLGPLPVPDPPVDIISLEERYSFNRSE